MPFLYLFCKTCAYKTRPFTSVGGYPTEVNGRVLGLCWIMTNSDNLTVESFTKLWETKLLPSIRAEFKNDFAILRAEMKKLSTKFDEIENSQKWLSAEYDNLKKATQTTKKQVADINKSIKELEERWRSAEDDNCNLHTALDNLQQYSRRDCIEINGIPVPAHLKTTRTNCCRSRRASRDWI